jgi:branched-chain amino acid transport system substrate-binding protein
MAMLLRHLGEEDRAARLLLDNPPVLENSESLEELRAAAAGLSLQELEALHSSLSLRRVSPRVAGTVVAEYARALALAGEADRALEVAESVAGDDLAPEDRQLVRAVQDGRVRPDRDPVTIGAVLSLTGRFALVGESLRDGIQLAFRARNELAEPGERVELVVLDDRSDPAVAATQVAALESMQVAAILGPIRSDALMDAASARSSAALTIVSPTAARDSGTDRHVFSIWDRSRREQAVGEAIGRSLPERLGLYRLAALYPDSDGGRAGFRAFESAASSVGATITASAAYQPDSTTFQLPIEAVTETDPEGVMVLAEDAGTVLQIAPQLSYFGLRSRVIAGGETWSDPAVLRRLDPAFSDYRLVATFVDRGAAESAWADFVTTYEEEYRRPAPDNLLAALGYDAGRLVTEAVTSGTLGRPGAVSRAILDAGFLDGATGRIRWTLAGRPAREVDVKMVRDRRLVEVDPEAISIWAEEARAQEELMKELEEEEEKRKAEQEARRQ